jgi:hypothetical protein
MTDRKRTTTFDEGRIRTWSRDGGEGAGCQQLVRCTSKLRKSSSLGARTAGRGQEASADPQELEPSDQDDDEEDNRRRTCRFPRRSALTMLLRQSLRTETRILMDYWSKAGLLGVGRSWSFRVEIGAPGGTSKTGVRGRAGRAGREVSARSGQAFSRRVGARSKRPFVLRSWRRAANGALCLAHRGYIATYRGEGLGRLREVVRRAGEGSSDRRPRVEPSPTRARAQQRPCSSPAEYLPPVPSLVNPFLPSAVPLLNQKHNR